MAKAKVRNASPMKLARFLHDDVSNADWSAGSSYLAANRVTLQLVDERAVLAEVRGTAARPYRVAIELSNASDSGDVVVACSCPRFDSHSSCKHLAATILAADKAGIQNLLPNVKYLGAVPIDQSAIPDLFEHFKFDIEQFAARGGVGQAKPAAQLPDWQRHMRALQRMVKSYSSEPALPSARAGTDKPRKFFYFIDLHQTGEKGRPVVVLHQRQRRKNGEWGTIKPIKSTTDETLEMADAEDRPLLEMLFGNDLDDSYYGSYWSPHRRVAQVALAPALFDVVLPRLCATGRCGLGEEINGQGPTITNWLAWDDGPAWRFEVAWTHDEQSCEWRAVGSLVRDVDGARQRIDLQDTRMIMATGLLFLSDRIAKLEPVPAEQMPWAAMFRHTAMLSVPETDQDSFVGELWRLPAAARPALPEPLRWESTPGEPKPRVVIVKPKHRYVDGNLLGANVTFSYGSNVVKQQDAIEAFTDPAARRAVERNREREAERWQELRDTGFANPDYYLRSDYDLQIHNKKLSTAVMWLTERGWSVEAEGLVIRRPGKISVSVSSGVDWFDLAVECDFGGIKVALPELLAAVAKGEKFITLGDGSRGMLPEEWLAKYAPLVELGETEGDALRFRPSQAMILDALLDAQPESHTDARFAEVRDRLRNFAGVEPVQEPESFQGQLREYQRAGLGWLNFLREFRLGGCLADDMGLGKTVQVLALLEQRRVAAMSSPSTAAKVPIRRSSKSKSAPPDARPSLVVAPKSLVFNWLDEARRFTPALRTLDYTGLARKGALVDLSEIDLVVTTYGTLRRDILAMSKIEFEHVILDEAQAIKNAGSQSAKSCRLLQGRQRLAMTGTPVENHLGDLWSLFEFLNPGMLGRSSNLRLFAGKSLPDRSSVELLAKAVRPYLLRRTKEQVLTELPAKTEQTLYCELDDRQRKLYNELRDHYRALLAKKIDTDGLGKAKIQVLEALLRLRQAACHPALIDKSKAEIPSAKLETLLEQLDEVLAEGHKVLVFSQFTSLLALVRAELDRRGITYEYLDGKSTHRKDKVARFQTDVACPVFLISLKAGGHGLNLTAADYVFILDPWWNPAVEAQAVDRAHRIGQDKPVFAYRLIARDTVEEKILELQGHKRDLADAVITADENLLRTLTAADLQLLLS